MKIAIIGTHGAGKTTLSYLMAAAYKKIGTNVKIVQEVARSCPYPLNEGMSREACLWIYHEHVKKELDAIQKHDIVICDRSALDSFMYAKAQNCYDYTDRGINLCFESASHWMKTYDQIIYVKPGKIKPMEDGVRSVDLEFQRRVAEQFNEWFLNNSTVIKSAELDADAIFDQENLMERLLEKARCCIAS